MSVPSVEEALSAAVVDDVRVLADRLRRAADRIEERIDRPVPVNLRDLCPNHGDVAADAVHEVATLIANLRLDSLIRHAHEADAAARRGFEEGR